MREVRGNLIGSVETITQMGASGMAIIRASRPEANYTIISNLVIRDNKLSFRARGVLLSLLSRPADWRTSAEALSRESVEGRSAILTALTELENGGYLIRVKGQDVLGRWHTNSYVYDVPQTESRLSDLGQPNLGEPTSENRTLIKELITNNYEEQEPAVAVVIRNSEAREAIEDIQNRLAEARAAGINAWNLSTLGGSAYDQLDVQGKTGAVIEFTGWYLSEMLNRPLTASEYARTAQLLKRYGRIGFQSLDYAVTKAVDDPWSYAYKTAEAVYKESKK